MKNMLIDALENAFDDYFKYSRKNNYSITEYTEELEKFAQFVVKEYSDSLKNEEYWANRADKE